MFNSILTHVLVVKKCKDPVKIAVQRLFIWGKYQVFSWYSQMSPFPCSLPDPAPISPSAPLRTAGVRAPRRVWDGSRTEEEVFKKKNKKKSIQMEKSQTQKNPECNFIFKAQNSFKISFIAFPNQHPPQSITEKLEGEEQEESWRPSVCPRTAKFLSESFRLQSCSTLDAHSLLGERSLVAFRISTRWTSK